MRLSEETIVGITVIAASMLLVGGAVTLSFWDG